MLLPQFFTNLIAGRYGLAGLMGGLLLVYPGLVTDLIGLGLVMIMGISQIVARKQHPVTV